jgi:hypothetical protein
VKNSPDCCRTSHGEAAAEARTEPRKESDTMPTATAAPTSAQLSTEQAEALAIAMASSHPLMLRWDRPEVRRILGTIDLAQWAHTAPERRTIGRVWSRWHTAHSSVAGLDICVDVDAWDLNGEIVVDEAMVGCVEEFVAQWGEPATHERAQEIAETRLAELSGQDRDQLERDIQRESDDRAREAHELRGV